MRDQRLQQPILDQEDREVVAPAGGGGIPRREQLLHVGWMFLFASITLLAEFLMFYTDYPTTAGGNLCLGIGLVSSVEWLHGFIILWHWTWMLPGDKDWAALTACSFKTIASVFFCVFPFTGLLGSPCAWSNLAGIVLFHSGNIIDTVNMMRNSCNYQQCCSPGNFPTITMWVLLTATTFLIVGNSVFFAEAGPLANKTGEALTVVTATGQIFGSMLLGIGSIMSIYGSRNTNRKAVDGE